METIVKEQQIPFQQTEPGVEVAYRGAGADRIRMVINHNPREAVYDGQKLAPFQCSVAPAAE